MNGAENEKLPARRLVVDLATLTIGVGQSERAEAICIRCEVSPLDFLDLLPKPELAATGRTGDDQ